MNASRQSGKSQVTAILAAHTAIYHPRSLTLLFSKAQRQSTELFSKVAATLKALGDNSPRMEGDALTSCKLANGSRVVSLPGDGDSIRGFSAPQLCVCDEAAYIGDSLYAAIRPMLSVSNGRLILLSTPHGRQGAFYRAWKDESEDWERIRVTAEECPRISPAFLANELATLGPLFYFCHELVPLDITLAFGVPERRILR